MSTPRKNQVASASRKIGIIVPVYNTEEYLESCIESVQNQTYKNWICLLVDDGSTDSSPTIIRQYCEKDKRFIGIFQKNSGVGATRNNALDYLFDNYSDIDFISFIDSDDIPEPNMYEQLINAIESDRSDIALSGFTEFNEAPLSPHTKRKNLSFRGKRGVISRDEFLKLVFSMGDWNKNSATGGHVCKILYRMNLLKDIRFTSNRDVVEDELFNLQVSKNIIRVTIVPLFLYNYRQRRNSLTRDQNFLEQLIRGRYLCLEYSKKFSQNIYLLTLGALFKTLLLNFKNTGDNRFIVQIPDKDIWFSFKFGYISKKNFFIYKIIMNNYFFSFIYLSSRNFLRYLKKKK